MELESIDKYIHMTKLTQGVEVMFAGQPCLKISEGLDSYNWTIYPLFAKLTYGANIFEDVPYCFENFDTLEDAIADGLSMLYEMGAFNGEVDLPEDTYANGGVNEFEENLDEGLANTVKRGIKNLKRGVKGWGVLPDDDNNTSSPKAIVKRNKSYDDDTTKLLHKAMTDTDPTGGSPQALQKRVLDREMKKRGLTEDVLKSILEDCRAYAIKHTGSLLEAHDLATGLYVSILSEDADVKAATAFDWKSKRATDKPEPVKNPRGKPTFGASVEEMKQRMRENITAGKRPHTGFDRNEKLRILRSGAMESPEFSGTHSKAAGRPHGTTKAAADEKKKAEASVFSMWTGLGKKAKK